MLRRRCGRDGVDHGQDRAGSYQGIEEFLETIYLALPDPS
jgi:hypothetical protein